jgi:hypothetical protein
LKIKEAFFIFYSHRKNSKELFRELKTSGSLIALVTATRARLPVKDKRDVPQFTKQNIILRRQFREIGLLDLS